MPIIDRVGSRSWKSRLLDWAIHGALLVGAATMIFPLLMMLTNSVKGAVDSKSLTLLPAYLYDDNALYKRCMEAKHNELAAEYNSSHRRHIYSFGSVVPPAQAAQRRVEDWREFFAAARPSLDVCHMALGDAGGVGLRPLMHRRFLSELKAEPDVRGDIARLNDKYRTNFVGWDAVPLPWFNLLRRGRTRDFGPFNTRAAEFALRQEPSHLVIYSLDAFFVETGLKPQHGQDVAGLNRTCGLRFGSWEEVTLSRTVPADGLRQDWLNFVRTLLNLQFITVSPDALPDYRRFLAERYRDIAHMNERYGTSYARFDQAPLLAPLPASGVPLVDWDYFVSNVARPEHLGIRSVEFMYRDFLREKYGGLDSLNAAHGLTAASFDAVAMPIEDVEYQDFLSGRRAATKEFLVRNYATVLGSLLYDGRAVLNTAIYCTLSVLMALLVNPLAAYALSRFKPPSQYKLLLFLMLTMAFPPIVLGIPNFLLLRKLGMLNSFAALVLPSAASGYSIFLLKGFFDSLPRELYESASLDGASEWTMFWHVTMAASKPILAVVALGAFTAAYSSFMFAFITCQDPKMWTMMVSIYQLQQRSSPSVGMAALVIAAVPTLLVFVFCQNIIMRGIVVPTEK